MRKASYDGWRLHVKLDSYVFFTKELEYPRVDQKCLGHFDQNSRSSTHKILHTNSEFSYFLTAISRARFENF